MRESGQLLARVFSELDTFLVPGVSTMQINDRVEKFIVDVLHARPASKGQYDYEFVLNCSPNNVVCHGMPSETAIVGPSDIINIDITLEKNGFISDSSKMYLMEGASARARKLVATTYQAMIEGIRQVKPGATLGDIGYAIQLFAEAAGYSVVREYCGHGIGREMHEAPNVLHYGNKGVGLTLEPGMTFTVEPMINEGSFDTVTQSDGWTVVTKDGRLSAQWEHTVLVTQTGYEVLTIREGESI